MTLDLTEDNGSGCHGDVVWYRLLWGAKVYHLVTCLRQMADVKPTHVQGKESYTCKVTFLLTLVFFVYESHCLSIFPFVYSNVLPVQLLLNE